LEPEYISAKIIIMAALKEWLIPYIISNIVFLLSIVAALRKPMWTRIFLQDFSFGQHISIPLHLFDRQRFT
jgi:hypothetical protein